MRDHNLGRSKFTSMANDWTIIHFDEYHTEHEARSIEMRTKKNKKLRREFYLASANTWHLVK